jgi:hypothetical protein
MSNANHAREQKLLATYVSYLNDRGYKAKKIDESDAETPDLLVEGKNFEFLNEFKSPELILDTETNLYKFKTTLPKLLRHIHKAVGQLKQEDSDHSKMWVVTFTSASMQLHYKSLTDALQGGVAVNGKLEPDFTQTTTYKKLIPKAREVDLFVWLQTNDKMESFGRATFILSNQSGHKKEVEKFVVDCNSKKTGSFDGIIMLTWPTV